MQEISGRIFTPQGTFVTGSITIEDDRIVSVSECDASLLSEEENDCYIIPGLVDIHMHGAGGHDVCGSDISGLRSIVAYEREWGITSLCMATMTMNEDELIRAVHNIAEVNHPNIKGIYLEGPFISVNKCGSQNPENIIPPDTAMLTRLQMAAKNMIKVVVIAPEVDGAISMISELKDEYRFSIGHTDADYATALRAIEAGASEATHLYNGMSPMLHRSPGVIGAVADKQKVMVELIADGIHVHPSVVRSTFRMMGADRMVMISDSTEATGMSNGDYMLAGRRIHMSNRWALLEDGTIAGGASNLYDCMQEALKMGVPRVDVVKACTINPARAIGIDQETGSLEAGKKADILILDHDFKLCRVIQNEDDIIC